MVYANLYTLLKTLAHPTTPINFPNVPPVLLLLVAHMVEFYGLVQRRYLTFLPRPNGDIETLQPALFNVSTLHVMYGIDKAQSELGYNTKLGTMEGLCLAVKEWNERIEAKLTAKRHQPKQEEAANLSDMPVVLPARNL